MMDWKQGTVVAAASAATGGIESALTTLQPIRDLAKNWDIDIAAWYVTTNDACGLAYQYMTLEALEIINHIFVCFFVLR